MTDPPLNKQCWIFTCRREAVTYAKIKGTTRKVCDGRGKEYGSSVEQGFKL